MAVLVTAIFTLKRKIMEDYFRIGVITSPHGVRGEVSIFATTEDPDRFRTLEKVYFDMKGEMKPYNVTGCKFKKNMPVLKFEGIDSIDDIEKFRGVDIYVDREDAIPLEEGEYYIADVLGFDVISEDGHIGVLDDYFDNAADQTIFVVKCDDGTVKYIPDVEEFILDVNMDEHTINVHLIEGM